MKLHAGKSVVTPLHPDNGRNKRSKTFDPGTFIRIPLPDGSFGFGRALSDPYIGFYDLHSSEPIDDLDQIESKPLLFTQTVRLLDDQRWQALGQRPLTGEAAKPVLRFSQSRGDFRKCVIWDSTGMERPATPQECVGLERSAVWDARHIEQRLLDHFMGRPNEWEIRARVRLE